MYTACSANVPGRYKCPYRTTTQGWQCASSQVCSLQPSTHLPLPVVVPSLPGRGIGLHSRVLDWDIVKTVDTLLLHSHSVKISLTTSGGSNCPAKLLASVVHARVEAHPLLLGGLVLLATEKLPGAVDGPVTQVALASHTQGWRSRREHVALEHLDAFEVLRLGGLTTAANSGLAGALGGRLGRRLARQ